MDTRTKRMGQTNTDKNKKRENRVHAFKTLFFIDIQKDMVKDKVSPTFGETQIGMAVQPVIFFPVRKKNCNSSISFHTPF